ncbi:MAG: hypothetical protein V2B18_08015 [Pseudomonadota bacterium]
MKTQSPLREGEAQNPALILIYGDDFLVRENLRDLLDRLLPAELRDTNLTVLDGNNPDIAKLSSAIYTSSLFGGPRVVLVEDTHLFMGKTDKKKTADKVLSLWKANDRKGALRALSQLLSVAGISVDELRAGPDWTKEVLPESADPGDRRDLLNACAAFLDEGKIVETAGSDAVLEEIIRSSLPSDVSLIFTAPEVDKRKKIFKAAEKHGKVIELTVKQDRYGGAMDRSFFDGRVKEAVAKAGKRISSPALHRMYARAGKDLRTLESELRKLFDFVGPRTDIKPEDIDAVFVDFHEGAAFQLSNAIQSSDPAAAVQAIQDMLRGGAHPLAILGSIAYEVRRLMLARELLYSVFKPYWKDGMTWDAFRSVIANVRRDNPALCDKSKFNLLSASDYPIYLSLKAARNYSLDKLIGIMEHILDADIMLKSSRLGYTAPDIILENLAIAVCKK